MFADDNKLGAVADVPCGFAGIEIGREETQETRGNAKSCIWGAMMAGPGLVGNRNRNLLGLSLVSQDLQGLIMR